MGDGCQMFGGISCEKLWLKRDIGGSCNDTSGKENSTSMILTYAGDWNVDFFKKNGYLLRGELKDVPKEHNCYELYKKFWNRIAQIPDLLGPSNWIMTSHSRGLTRDQSPAIHVSQNGGRKKPLDWRNELQQSSDCQSTLSDRCPAHFCQNFLMNIGLKRRLPFLFMLLGAALY